MIACLLTICAWQHPCHHHRCRQCAHNPQASWRPGQPLQSCPQSPGTHCSRGSAHAHDTSWQSASRNIGQITCCHSDKELQLLPCPASLMTAKFNAAEGHQVVSTRCVSACCLDTATDKYISQQLSFRHKVGICYTDMHLERLKSKIEDHNKKEKLDYSPESVLGCQGPSSGVHALGPSLCSDTRRGWL